jgi:hypothetical protein
VNKSLFNNSRYTLFSENVRVALKAEDLDDIPVTCFSTEAGEQILTEGYSNVWNKEYYYDFISLQSKIDAPSYSILLPDESPNRISINYAMNPQVTLQM